jgi:hypothetical protein
MSHPNTETDALIASMRKSVAKTLDRKRRLGQYAVIWKDGKVVRLEPEDIKPLAAAEDPAPYNRRKM